jgi:hypothetical protein
MGTLIMAYIQEQQQSREIQLSTTSASTTRLYHLFDYTEVENALTALSNYVPTQVVVGNLICVLPEYSITPVFSDPNRTLYEATVTYKTPDQADGGTKDEGESQEPQQPEDNTSFTFSYSAMSDVIQNSVDIGNGGTGRYLTDGTSSRITTSTINQQNPSLPPEGVEINTPIVTMVSKTIVPYYVATSQWFTDRFAQLWTTNDQNFQSFERNCLMFTGMDGSQNSDGNWSISMSFEYRPPTKGKKFSYWEKDASTPSTLTLGYHTGWAVFDAAYEQIQNISTDGYDSTVRSLSSLEVHHVYGESDFTQLDMVGV